MQTRGEIGRLTYGDTLRVPASVPQAHEARTSARVSGSIAACSADISKLFFNLFLRLIIYALPASLIPLPASAELSEEPYLFRFALALDRQSNSASTLGRQASIAYPEGGSINPAANSWTKLPTNFKVVTGTYVDAHAASGARFTALPITFTFHDAERGAFSAAYAHTETPDESGHDGLRQSLTSDEYWLGYSNKTSADTSMGIQVKFTDAGVKNEFFSPSLGGAGARQNTDLKSYDLSLGVLSRLTNAWWAGAVGALSLGKANNVFENIGALLLPSAAPPFFVVIPPGTILGVGDDVVRTLSVRGGLGYAPNEHLGVYGDFHFVHIESNNAGVADEGRVAVGAEFRERLLRLRGGVSVDSDRQIDFSIGLGYRLSHSVSWDIGYQNNAAPEVRAEFGHIRLISTSLSLAL